MILVGDIKQTGRRARKNLQTGMLRIPAGGNRRVSHIQPDMLQSQRGQIFLDVLGAGHDREQSQQSPKAHQPFQIRQQVGFAGSLH
jgi:hypothetical protein